MWSEVITGAASAAVAGLISWAIAKTAARAEIKKLRETWAHEREVAIDTDFDNMVSCISAYLIYGTLDNAIEASQAISKYRTKATENTAPIVDTLSVLFENPKQNQQGIKQTLDEIIERKRPSHS